MGHAALRIGSRGRQLERHRKAAARRGLGAGSISRQLWCDRQISPHERGCDAARRAARVIGIGELDASAFTASVADFDQFKSGGQFGDWLGVVPRQNSSGGKASLGLSWRVGRRKAFHGW